MKARTGPVRSAGTGRDSTLGPRPSPATRAEAPQDCADGRLAGSPGQVIRQRTIGLFTLSETFFAHDAVLAKHARREAQVTFVMEGGFRELYTDGSIACRRGAVRFLPAGEAHEDHIEAGSRCLAILIEPAALERLHPKASVPGRPAEVNGLAATWLAHRLYVEFSREDTASAMAIEGLILEILAETTRSEAQRDPALIPQWLKRATQIVESRFLERLSLASIASEVGVHYVHLSRQFHKYHGYTIGELLRRRRVQHACHLLAQSATPLAEIALICGFSDQSHLSFLFKRYMGLSPSKYRILARLDSTAISPQASPSELSPTPAPVADCADASL